MKRMTNALEASGLKRPVKPSNEEIARIIRLFDLFPHQAAELQALIDDFIAISREHLNKLERSLPQRDLALRLRRIEKSLRLVCEEAERSRKYLDEILPSELSRMIGGVLTYAALEKLTGSKQGTGNYRQVIKNILPKHGNISIPILEEHTAFERQSLGQKHAAIIFRSLLHDIHRPLARWVELDKRKAGRKSNALQDLLIERLATASVDIIGRKPSSTPNGRFVELCRAVLDSMGFPLGNTQKVVAAVLKRRRAGQK
jgi:hypothetical protein